MTQASMKAEEAISPWLRHRRTGINMVIKNLRNGSVHEATGLGWIPLEKLRAIPEYGKRQGDRTWRG